MSLRHIFRRYVPCHRRFRFRSAAGVAVGVNTLRRTARPPCKRRRDGASSGVSTSARCPSAALATRSRAALPDGVTSTMTTRLSPSGAVRRTQPRSTIALMELDIVGRLTPCSDASCGLAFEKMRVVVRLVAHHNDAGNACRAVGVTLKGRVPEIFRIMLLAGREANIRRGLVFRKGE